MNFLPVGLLQHGIRDLEGAVGQPFRIPGEAVQRANDKPGQ